MVLKLIRASLVATVIFHVDALQVESRRTDKHLCLKKKKAAMLRNLILNNNSNLKLLAIGKVLGIIAFLNS